MGRDFGHKEVASRLPEGKHGAIFSLHSEKQKVLVRHQQSNPTTEGNRLVSK